MELERSVCRRGALEAQTTKEIAELKSSSVAPGIRNTRRLVGIASQYELLGDGKNAYEYLKRAIAKDPKKDSHTLTSSSL